MVPGPVAVSGESDYPHSRPAQIPGDAHTGVEEVHDENWRSPFDDSRSLFRSINRGCRWHARAHNFPSLGRQLSKMIESRHRIGSFLLFAAHPTSLHADRTIGTSPASSRISL